MALKGASIFLAAGAKPGEHRNVVRTHPGLSGKSGDQVFAAP